MSSVAVPWKVAVPVRVAPLVGEVRLAVGGLSGGAAACETVNVCPAIVIVPARALAVVLPAIV